MNRTPISLSDFQNIAVPLHREMTLWSLVSQLLSSYQKKSPDVVVRTFLYLFHRIVLQIALLRLRSIKSAVIVKRVIHNECKCKCISRKNKCLHDFFVGLIQSFINSYDIQPRRIPWFITLVPYGFLDMPVARLPIWWTWSRKCYRGNKYKRYPKQNHATGRLSCTGAFAMVWKLSIRVVERPDWWGLGLWLHRNRNGNGLLSQLLSLIHISEPTRPY